MFPVLFLHNLQHAHGFMETAGFMAESVEKIFHLADQVSEVLLNLNACHAVIQF